MFPLRLNITSIVKRSATKVIGAIRGMNDSLYQTLPFSLSNTNRVSMPEKKGMPR
jgi:hypothetical protein